MRPLLPGAEPFRFDGSGEAGVLLVHGFTGTAYEMRPLGEHLATLGLGAAGVLLRGHGTHPDDLVGCRFEHWLADAEAALEELRARYRRVFLAGLSMGGTIALNLAARHAGDPAIAGVVSLCAPLRLTDWRLPFASILGHLVRWHAWGRPDIKDERAWDRHVAYRRFRSHTVREVLALIDQTRHLLDRVHQPILVVQARTDHIVPPRNAELILAAVSSADRRLLWLDNCYHVVTVDFSAPVLNAEVGRFILERAGDPSVSPAHAGAGAIRCEYDLG